MKMSKEGRMIITAAIIATFILFLVMFITARKGFGLRDGIGISLLSAVVGLGLMRIFLYRRVGREQVLLHIEKEWEVLRVFNEPEWFWVWQYWRLMRNAYLYSFAQRLHESTVSVQPITANPKVRKLTILARFTFGGTPKQEEALRRTRDRLKQPYNDDRLVEYFLYEFAEKCSKELGAFYNPMSNEQQAEFVKLIIPWMREKTVGQGLHIHSASFSLN